MKSTNKVVEGKLKYLLSNLWWAELVRFRLQEPQLLNSIANYCLAPHE